MAMETATGQSLGTGQPNIDAAGPESLEVGGPAYHFQVGASRYSSMMPRRSAIATA